MTRINCVDPARLSDKHLLAEYRELPRAFNLVRAAIARGERPNDQRNPQHYRLGGGHVRFFYSRLGYLIQRQRAIIIECLSRGFNVNYTDDPMQSVMDIPLEWFNDWIPTDEDIELNLQRIDERGGVAQCRTR